MSTTATITTMTTTTNQQNQPKIPMMQFVIVERLRKFQLVNQAVTLVNQSYTRIKSINSMVNTTLSQVEMVANQLARSVVTTFEPTIHLADSLVCQSFDKIEAGITKLTINPPTEFIRKRLEETMDMVENNTKQVRSFVNQKINQTRSKIETVGKQSSERFHSMLNVSERIIRLMDNSLTAADNVLDRLLPAINKQVEITSTNHQHQLDVAATTVDSLRCLFQRMVYFSDKLRRRFWQHTAEKWFVIVQQSALEFRYKVFKILFSQMSTRLQLNSSTSDDEKSTTTSIEGASTVINKG